MSHELLALGVSHHTAPLALREKLAMPEGRATGVLSELRAGDAVHEVVVVSTCNRTELYMITPDAVEAESAALAVLSRQAEIRPTELTDSLYAMRDTAAVRHLFSVASGLDSMIIGEAEIQGQIKRAYELALVEGATGPITNRLFREALGAGKRVRTETGVGRSRVSVSSVAVELATAMLGDLSKRRVLVIGAGETGELTARALRAGGVETVFVANRRYDRAIGLAQRFGGSAVRFDDLPAELARTDIVVSSTASPHQILDRDDLELTMAQRPDRPLVLIDIAVPRDVDPTARDLPGVALYDMDDLQRAAARGRSVREAESTRARSLVEEEVERFDSWLASLDVVPTIAALRERGEHIVQTVLHENQNRWESLSDADRERLVVMARAVVSRLLHEPTLRLKQSVEASEGDGDSARDSYFHIQALRDLFDLDAAAPDLGEGRGAKVADLESRRRRRHPS